MANARKVSHRTRDRKVVDLSHYDAPQCAVVFIKTIKCHTLTFSHSFLAHQPHTMSSPLPAPPTDVRHHSKTPTCSKTNHSSAHRNRASRALPHPPPLHLRRRLRTRHQHPLLPAPKIPLQTRRSQHHPSKQPTTALPRLQPPRHSPRQRQLGRPKTQDSLTMG